MRRLAVSVAVVCAVLCATACGARSELLSELGGALGLVDGGGHGHELPDGAPDNDANDDDASMPDGADKEAGEAGVNPCGGYQAYAPWPAFQRCSGHVGRSDAVGPTNPSIQWSIPVGRAVGEEQGVLGPPTIAADGTIYIADLYGEVVAISPSGSTNWIAHPTSVETGPSAVAVGADGSLYVELDQLYSITPQGSPIWTSPVHPGAANTGTLGPTTSSVTLSEDGQLYLGTEEGLVSINPNGGVIWMQGTLQQGWTPAIDTAGIIYTGNDTGQMIAWQGGGTSLWTFNAPGPDDAGGGRWIQAAPVIGDDGVVYFGAASGFYAFLASGDVKWEIPWTTTVSPGEGAFPAIGADETVYLASPDSMLRSISPKGVVNWTLPIGLPGSPP